MFLKNKNIIFKIRRSKVTDYTALILQHLSYIPINMYDNSFDGRVLTDSINSLLLIYHHSLFQTPQHHTRAMPMDPSSCGTQEQNYTLYTVMLRAMAPLVPPCISMGAKTYWCMIVML